MACKNHLTYSSRKLFKLCKAPKRHTYIVHLKLCESVVYVLNIENQIKICHNLCGLQRVVRHLTQLVPLMHSQVFCQTLV